MICFIAIQILLNTREDKMQVDTFPNKWKIFQWDEKIQTKKQTNNQPNNAGKACHRKHYITQTINILQIRMLVLRFTLFGMLCRLLSKYISHFTKGFHLYMTFTCVVLIAMHWSEALKSAFYKYGRKGYLGIMFSTKLN